MPHDVAYQVELNRVASLLGINHARDLEDAIIDHCLKQLREWVASHGELETLNELVDRFAQSLDMRFEEVHGHDGMTSLMERMDPAERPILRLYAPSLEMTPTGLPCCGSIGNRGNPRTWP